MDWHERYLQQARWTKPLRTFLFEKTGLNSAGRVLEVGCGTGAILEEISQHSGVFGLDIDFPILAEYGGKNPGAKLTCGDGVSLPFSCAVFDIVFCHFLLLWVSDPLAVLSEMRRVTRSGGAVIAMAEPDYSGRIDYPISLSNLGRWQTQSLVNQGADPNIGRKLSGMFNRSGLHEVQTGVLGGEWGRKYSEVDFEMEWKVIYADLEKSNLGQNLAEIKEFDKDSQKRGERVLFVPTFYALGIV